MRRRLTRILLLLALGVAIGWWLYRTPADRASPHLALDHVVPVVRFRDAPLEQVLRECERVAGVPIEVQWESLEQRGVTRDTPVTLHRYQDTLRDVLRTIVRTAPNDEFTMAFEADDGRILVGVPADMPGRMVLRVYDVKHLVRQPSWLDQASPPSSSAIFNLRDVPPDEVIIAPPPPWPAPADPVDRRRENLVALIVTLIDPDGPTTVRFAGDDLVVAETFVNQQRIAKLLEAANPDRPFQCEWPGPCADDAAWQALLARRAAADLRLEGVPFDRALDHLRETFRANIELDEELEVDAGFDESRLVSLRLQRPTFQEAVLALGRYAVATPGGIAFGPDGDNGVALCNASAARRLTITEFYDVRPILGPAHSEADLAAFLKRMTAEIAPDTWIHRGGDLGHANRSFEGRAIILHTRETHRLIRQWLDAQLAQVRHPSGV